MRDIVHQPELVESDGGAKFLCSECGAQLPADACVGLPVVEIPSAGFFPDFDGGNHIKCTSTAVDSVRKQAEGIASIEVTEAELAPGEQKKAASPLSDVEKMANRGGFQNFLAMREMTRLREDG